MKEMLIEVYNYTCWANDKILEKAEQIDKQQLLDSTPLGHGSLYETIFHTVSVEIIWRTLTQSGDLDPATLPQSADHQSVEALRALWAAERVQMHEYLNALSEDELIESITLRDWQGNERIYIRWKLLVHLMLHSMQHRTESAAILTEQAQSPGDIDFLFFID